MPALKDTLEGRPLRTPLHPALVHLPIALLPLSLVLDVLSRLLDRAPEAPLVEAAFVSLLAGIGTALLAAVFGFVDYTSIRDDHPAKKTATLHLILNLVAVGLYAASAGLRFSTLAEARTPMLPLLVSLAATIILGISGYLGGVLVYDDGIAVGRHRRRAPLPEATIVLRAQGQPAPVMNDADLAEGESVRVDLDGVIATVVRHDGTVYAIQEFCTHRFGPLSEGKFCGGEVTCPWHRSRFDLRTGEPTHGPAKVPLRIFRTEIRDGKIWLLPPSPVAQDDPARS